MGLKSILYNQPPVDTKAGRPFDSGFDPNLALSFLEADGKGSCKADGADKNAPMAGSYDFAGGDLLIEEGTSAHIVRDELNARTRLGAFTWS